ncbi:MAG: exonuclease of the beta-lactamase fold involved in processing-like protein [Chthoniobacteraceae bacterium]|nr:exonuclease of the beta-lactamase fold involved in processing-like protein [Chthoniobacteraceae bacterium]
MRPRNFDDELDTPAFSKEVTLLRNTSGGLYCEAGDFYIDPWKGVDYAVITHAHSDHARIGSRNYLASEEGRAVLQERLGPESRIESLPYGKSITRNGVTISFHPAGHILGSAQVRVEYRGEIWVASGDYKVEAEPTCTPFEPVRCHTFITESTFGLPIYRWRPQAEVFADVNGWWRANQAAGRTSVLFAYSLGKAQRVLAGIDPSIGPIFVHGAVAKLLPHYAAAGVELPEVQSVETFRAAEGRGLVVGPASIDGTPWLRKFGEISKAFASGWMQLRGARRRQALDRGFVLSDHADWQGLLSAIRATGAERIWVTHGSTGPMVRWLRENGWEAQALVTRFFGEAANGKEEAEEKEP